ncbi:hypothetical protein ONA92_26350 [Mycobacteroides salmoniphilum]|uniref:hypothetical protein n=1 Tax=Mycobacteroides salmoniphilum TaxID=404941 RepID=UPI003568F181
MVSEAMPSRKYSSLILPGSWPSTSSQTEHAGADAAAKAAAQAEQAADAVRNVAERFISETGGRFAGAQYEGYMRDYQLGLDHAGFLKTLEASRSEIADEVHSCKGRLDHIDWEANDKIAQLESAGSVAGAVKLEIVAAARSMAMADASATAAKISAIGAKLAGKTPPPPRPGSGGDKPGDGMQHSPKIERPGEVSPMGNEHDKEGGPHRGDSDRQGDKGASGSDKAGHDKPTQNGKPEDASSGGQQPMRAERQPGSPSSTPSLGNAAGASPLSGGGSPGGGNSGGSGGGLGSGLMGGSNPSSALQSGLKGMGNSGGGSSPGGLGSGLGRGGAPPSAGSGGGSSAGGVNPMRDFARGFTQGASTPPPSTIPQQAAPPPAQGAGLNSAVAPPQAAPAASPAAGGASGPAMTPVSSPAPTPPPASAPAPGAGGAGLPPVGSDLVKHSGSAAAPSGSAVTSGAQTAAQASPAASSVAGGAATASMAALAGSRGKAAPNAAGEVPVDPLLADAVRLTYQLLHGSRFFAGIDWCVGVFRSEGGAVETVVTSNEGAGYVPAGVFLPRSARLLFADSVVDKAFRDQWFGFTEPVATMMAYAELRREPSGKLPLYAVAASSMMGGALGAAEVAGVEHVHLCYPADSPFAVTDGDQVLDDLHVHRLTVVDPESSAWFANKDRTVGEVTARCAELTSAAWGAVGARLGSGDMLVPDVGAAVYNTLQFGDVVDAKRWDQLWEAMCEAQWSAAAVRPDADSAVSVELYSARHDIARLMEMLYWWRPSPDGDGEESVRFTEIAYCAEQIEGVK